MTHYPIKSWLITGTAGFIGSNLLEALLDQNIVGLAEMAGEVRFCL